MTRFYPVAVIVVIVVFGAVVFAAGGSPATFVDPVSFLLVAVPTALLSGANYRLAEIGRFVLLALGARTGRRDELLKAKVFFEALARYLLTTGVIASFVAAVTILSNLSGEPERIAAGTAIALLSILYAMLLYLVICVPLRTGICTHLAEWSDAATDE